MPTDCTGEPSERTVPLDVQSCYMMSRVPGYIMVKQRKITNNGRKGGNSRSQTVSNAGIRKPLKRTRKRSARNKGKMVSAVYKHGLNAFHSLHVPLPISTGKYNVIRTKTIKATDSYLSLIGPMDFQLASNTYTGGMWTNYGGIFADTGTQTVNGNYGVAILPSPTGSDSRGWAEVVPSAFSVQIVNTQSLTNASGIVYMGRCSQTLSGPESGDSRTISDFSNALLSYADYKALSGAALAMKPQQINLMPANISELSDFKELGPPADQAATPTLMTWDGGHDFAGFKPAFVINPDRIPLSITICCEWRVRLSPFNPMHNTQTLHKPTSHDTWHNILATAESAGHGVEDVGIAGAAGYMMSGAGEGLLAEAGAYISSAATAALPWIESAVPLLL
jgi:hypothetical protein